MVRVGKLNVRRVVPLALASLLAFASASGLTSTSASATSRGHATLGQLSTYPAVPTPAVPVWGTCPSKVPPAEGLQCAALKVPLDYAHPRGQHITLELSRLRHTSSAANYLGVMLTNPGGPGGSGLTLAGLGRYVPNGVGGRFDWIGWDPRGVGASRPAINCIPTYFGTDRPSYSAAGNRPYWLHQAKSYAAACEHKYPALLPHMTTQDNARDMDVIRQALRQTRISYYGFSWGSYLGQTYMSLFPTHVRRIVLDGVVDPRRVWYGANLDQDVAFERNIKIFFAWVAANNSVYHLGTTEAEVYAAYKHELATLSTMPAAGGKVGPDELGDVLLDAGYYVFNWAQDASSFSKLVRSNDGTAVLKTYEANNAGASNENGFAVYNAVQCTDASWPGWSQTLRDAIRINRIAPFETWSNTWYNAPCLTWGARPHTPVRIHSTRGLPKILLISETYDAATPFSGALEMRMLFPTASLIEGVHGTTHAGSLSGVACTDNAVARYLATGSTPTRRPGGGSDLKCPPVPRPAASLSARASAAVSR